MTLSYTFYCSNSIYYLFIFLLLCQTNYKFFTLETPHARFERGAARTCFERLCMLRLYLFILFCAFVAALFGHGVLLAFVAALFSHGVLACGAFVAALFGHGALLAFVAALFDHGVLACGAFVTALFALFDHGVLLAFVAALFALVWGALVRQFAFRTALLLGGAELGFAAFGGMLAFDATANAILVVVLCLAEDKVVGLFDDLLPVSECEGGGRTGDLQAG